MAGVKAWITVVSYLSPHLQPVVSLSEDVVKPSQTLKHPVASPGLYSPQPPQPTHTHTHTHTHTSPLWQFTLGWGLSTVDGSRLPEMLFADGRTSWISFGRLWNMGVFFLTIWNRLCRRQRMVVIMKWDEWASEEKNEVGLLLNIDLDHWDLKAGRILKTQL